MGEDANNFETCSAESTLKVSQENVIESGVSKEILLDIEQVNDTTAINIEKNTHEDNSNLKSVDIKEELKPNDTKDEEVKDFNKVVTENVSEILFKTEENCTSEIEETQFSALEKNNIELEESSCNIRNIKNDTTINEQQISNQSAKGAELKESMTKTTELLKSVSEKLEKGISEVCEESTEIKEKELNDMCKNSNNTIDVKTEKQENVKLDSNQEINTEVPINSDDGENKVVQLQSLEKDYVSSSSEKMEDSSVNSIKTTKERNITLKDINITNLDEITKNELGDNNATIETENMQKKKDVDQQNLEIIEKVEELKILPKKIGKKKKKKKKKS